MNTKMIFQEIMTEEYKIIPFSKSRQVLSDIYELFSEKHYMNRLFEVDVSAALRKLKKLKQEEDYSFTAWLVYVIATTIERDCHFRGD